jgi:dolichol-phosphate mannosyltransferase
MPKVVVVTPTYNEAKNLPLLVEELFALPLDNLHLLVVDDHSPDGTGEIAEQLSSQYNGKITVLHRAEKSGLGPAYIAGFKQALSMDADIVLQMDADFSHQPGYISDMLEAIEQSDLVIGSRYVKGGSVDEGWGTYRKLLSWFANRIYTPLILGISVYDATGGYRCWRRQTLIGVDLDRIRSNGYVFQVEMAYITCRLGFRVQEIPIHFPDRKFGISKMSPRIASEAALRVWQLLFRHRTLTPKQRRTEPYTLREADQRG